MDNLAEKVDLPVSVVRDKECQINSYVMGIMDTEKSG